MLSNEAVQAHPLCLHGYDMRSAECDWSASRERRNLFAEFLELRLEWRYLRGLVRIRQRGIGLDLGDRLVHFHLPDRQELIVVRFAKRRPAQTGEDLAFGFILGAVRQNEIGELLLQVSDGSCIRLRPERPNHVWSYGFVQDQTEDKRPFRMLTVIDEYTRRCLAIIVARRLRSDDVLHCLTDLMGRHGPPEHIRSDNGPQFVATRVRGWLGRIGVKTLYIEPGSPAQNAFAESFNSKLRDELLEGEQFSTLYEAQVPIERWRRHYNTVKPHSSLGYRPPAPETILPSASDLAYAPARPDAGR